uniref:Uncharacterized protein n=1 Tax=Lepeophtheirus salmonis TaxID=72036 RepID=A0A0K2V855_LEPSM
MMFSKVVSDVLCVVVDSCALKSPLPHPTSIVCFSYNVHLLFLKCEWSSPRPSLCFICSRCSKRALKTI